MEVKRGGGEEIRGNRGKGRGEAETHRRDKGKEVRRGRASEAR